MESMNVDHPTGVPDPCVACAVASSRRAFLRDATAAAAAALAVLAIGSGPDRAGAQLVHFVEALPITGRKPATLSYAIPAADGAHIDTKNEVILVRWKNAIYAFNLACPHQNTALKWDDGAKQFQCPKHHSRYEPDGAFIDGRATRGMDRFAITKTAAGIAVDVDTLYQQDKQSTQWVAALVHV
jgi:nitrite reductase/ring-hydroxylating ferredoxin subunit